ncbi:hydroxyacid dehydrogenase [Chloroflexota bacterium]
MGKVLVADHIAKEAIRKLQSAGHEVVEIKDDLTEKELINTILPYDAIIVRGIPEVTRSIIEAGRNLKIIARGGIGLDNIDCNAAEEKGITVVNTPGASCLSVAELAIGLMFTASRKITRADAALKKGQWIKKECLGCELAGKTLGIVGAGGIGQALARIAGVLGMEVIATKRDLSTVPPALKELGVPVVPLDELLSRADYISLHLPKTAESTMLIGEPQFNKMKDGVIFINCARGGIVDEAALAQAVRCGKVAAAAVDVFAKEPLDRDNPLLGLENVILTPHIGASSVEGQFRVGMEVADKVIRALA